MGKESVAGRSREPAAPLWVTSLLQVLAVLVILMTAVTVFVQVASYAKQPDPIKPIQLVGLIAGFVAGLAGGALLLAIATTMKYWYASLRSVRRLEQLAESLTSEMQATRLAVATNQPAPPSTTANVSPARQPVDPQILQTVLALLGDIRDNTLLGDEQRRLKLDRLITEQKQRQIAQADAMINQGDFHRAQQILEELIRRFGPTPEFESLANRVRDARARLEMQHIEAAKKKLDDLLSVNAWDRADEVTADLLSRHPDSAEVREVADRVHTQKTRFQAEQKTRLLAEAQKHTTRREWQAALQTAQLLVRRYPDSPEAEAIKPQLPTLEANAEVAARQALETQIKQMIKEQRYADAVEIAGRVLRDYPASPQAQALRSQLPKLRELAEGLHGAAPPLQ